MTKYLLCSLNLTTCDCCAETSSEKDLPIFNESPIRALTYLYQLIQGCLSIEEGITNMINNGSSQLPP